MTKYNNVFIKNIYYMLSYAFGTLKHDGYKKIAAENFDNIHDLLAAILSKAIARQLKHGLYREYISVSDELPTIRGKVDIIGTVKNRIVKKHLISCDYDILSENNIYNCIIKTTAFLLIKSKYVSACCKTALKKEMLFFGNVDTVEPENIRWTNIRFQRNNADYRILLNLCRLIIEGMLMTDESGEYTLSKFIDEQKMCRLYEKFILEYYKKEWRQIKADSPQIQWALDDTTETMLPSMQSDIMLSKDNDILIIDAKFYAHTTQTYFNKKTIHSNNLYQIFTYVKNKEYEFEDIPHKVSGLLLYAKTDEQIQPDCTYMMSGNKISVKTLDMNKNFSEIAAQLNNIAKEIIK